MCCQVTLPGSFPDPGTVAVTVGTGVPGGTFADKESLKNSAGQKRTHLARLAQEHLESNSVVVHSFPRCTPLRCLHHFLLQNRPSVFSVPLLRLCLVGKVFLVWKLFRKFRDSAAETLHSNPQNGSRVTVGQKTYTCASFITNRNTPVLWFLKGL